jgi:hypothetical protein
MSRIRDVLIRRNRVIATSHSEYVSWGALDFEYVTEWSRI